MEILFEYLGKGFMIMLSISMPCVLTAAAIGLVIGILQAVTQVQEQTIVAAPKIFSVFLVIMIFGIGFSQLLINLLKEGSQLAFDVVPKNENYVISSDYFRYTKPFAQEMQADGFENQPDINEIMKNPGKAPFIDKNERAKYLPADKYPRPKPNFIETNKIIGR